MNLYPPPVYVKKYSACARLDTRATPIYYAAMQRAEYTANKDEIRQQALERRRALPPHHVAASSRGIAERVLALPIYTQARCLHIYVSGKDNEVDTLPLI